ncbi:guanylate-binding protein 3-like [Amphiura filiformis]|uniref:guanylate-binding protein 3-like n=1 Tax=Amphiura filiformis TaxID=82378 RepID=UPI003B2282EB
MGSVLRVALEFFFLVAISLASKNDIVEEQSTQSMLDQTDGTVTETNLEDLTDSDIIQVEDFVKPDDRPMQLIKPDFTHKKLVMVEENVKALLHLEGAVAVVAVVGKYHSGKSFLLNQLMSKNSGFGFRVGPTLRPETMGIWMWGKPSQMELPNGQQVQVVFLDTEGFAGSNVSESYDAKIFAVSALLSSYLIYNSVKIIDQADLDYLELLARRTQLFALRSQLSRAKWAQDFNHNLLNFPPLLWIIKDFVQALMPSDGPNDALDDASNPQAWLHHMMHSSAWENEDHSISLLDIFKSVECRTLFIPATSKRLLQDLSQATEADLTTEYKEERDQIKELLRKGLIPKEKNGRPITGPELASLIEVLVTAANEGSLSKIPSRWASFVSSMEKSAQQDCLKFYDVEISVLHQQHENGPINERKFKEWHMQAVNKSTNLLEQVLFGFDDVLNVSKPELLEQMNERFEKSWEINERKIRLRCSEVHQKIELVAIEQLQDTTFPVKTSDLAASYNRVKGDCIQQFEDSLEQLQENAAFNKSIMALMISLNNIRDSYILKNKKAIEEVLVTAATNSIDHFKRDVNNPTSEPRSPAEIKRLTLAEFEKAVDLFHQQTEVAHENHIYDAHLALVKSGLIDARAATLKQNDNLVRDKCTREISRLVNKMKERTDSTVLILPMNDTDLDQRLSFEFHGALREYSDILDTFSSMESYHEGSRALQRSLHAVSGQRRRRDNMEAYRQEVEAPLQKAKQIAMLSVEHYTTVFSVTKHITEICLLQLDEGKPQHWSHDLKLNIIDIYLNGDSDIQKVIKARKGLWSTLVGFIEWFLWLFS